MTMNPLYGGERIFYLDLIKCVGIILVIYGHVELFGFGIGDSVLSDIIYTFNMPLFFFVSGMLAFKKKQKIGYYFSNTWKKITILLIPTILFSLLSALIQMTEIDFSSGFGRYWFGCALLECFIIYYMVCVVTKTESEQLVLMSIFSIAGIIYLSTGAGDKYFAMIELNHLTKYLHFFTLGLLAKKFSFYYKLLLNAQILRTIVIGLYFILFFLLRYDGLLPTMMEHFLNDIFLRYLGLFVIVMFLYDKAIIINQKGKSAKIVKKLAENSFGIYLLQYFFLPDFRGKEWFSQIDSNTLFIMCSFFSIWCIFMCIVVIEIITRSRFLSHYVLGKR